MDIDVHAIKWRPYSMINMSCTTDMKNMTDSINAWIL